MHHVMCRRPNTCINTKQPSAKKTLSTESPCESICCSNYIPGATKFPRQGGVEGGRREGPWTREGPEGVPRGCSCPAENWCFANDHFRFWAPRSFSWGGVGPIVPRSAEEGSVGRGWAIKSRCLPSSSKQGAIEARL